MTAREDGDDPLRRETLFKLGAATIVSIVGPDWGARVRVV